MWAVILTVLETAKSFWILISKNRFLKLKVFALKMRSRFGNTYICKSRLRTFSTMKQVKSTVKTEIERQTKHWTIFSDLLPLALVLLKER